MDRSTEERAFEEKEEKKKLEEKKKTWPNLERVNYSLRNAAHSISSTFYINLLSEPLITF